MLTNRRAFICLLLLIVQSVAFAQETPPAPLKVLFIGNSYTSVNDLPATVVGLAEAAGGRRIEADRHLVGGCTLEKHVKDRKAVDKIHAAKWDVVVLQEHSMRPVIDRQAMHEYARLLDAEIKQQGAKTVFYLTWARQHIPDMQEGADPPRLWPGTTSPVTIPNRTPTSTNTGKPKIGTGNRGDARPPWPGS